MKLYQNEIKKTQGSSYIAFTIDEKDIKWFNKGQIGLFNLTAICLLEETYPKTELQHFPCVPFLIDEGKQDEKLLLINIVQGCGMNGEKTDALIRSTISNMIKNNLLSNSDGKSLLEECSKILSVPFIKLSQPEVKQSESKSETKKQSENKSDAKKSDKNTQQTSTATSNVSQNYCGFRKGFLL